MVRGRGRAAFVGVAVVAALTVVGCGASTHSDEPRPQVSTRISVVINPHQILLQRGDVGSGEEKSQQIPQNRNAKQPAIKTDAPLNVTFVAANQTGEATHLVVKGPKEVKSENVLARSPATFGASLPTGSYTVTAPEIPGAAPAHFTVGSYRASSENDVLLP